MDVEETLGLLPDAGAVPPVTARGPLTIGGIPIETPPMLPDASALRVFAEFPVLLDMCMHTARSIDCSGEASVRLSATAGVVNMVRANKTWLFWSSV
jgi:hypothetical protein